MIFSALIGQSISALKERRRLQKKQQYWTSNHQTKTEKTNRI